MKSEGERGKKKIPKTKFEIRNKNRDKDFHHEGKVYWDSGFVSSFPTFVSFVHFVVKSGTGNIHHEGHEEHEVEECLIRKWRHS